MTNLIPLYLNKPGCGLVVVDFVDGDEHTASKLRIPSVCPWNLEVSANPLEGMWEFHTRDCHRTTLGFVESFG